MSEQINMAAHYEHEIPEGYEARIEGNKVIIELKESEDEKIRKDIINLIEFALKDGSVVSPGSRTTKEEALAWLEKRKEQKSEKKLSRDEYVKRFKTLCNFYEINLPNREYDIYHLCDDLSKLSINCGKQQPTEWSEDIRNWKNIAYYVLKEWLGIGQYLDNPALDKIAEELQKMYGSVNPVSIPQWSEEDKRMLEWAIACCQKTIGQLPQAAANWLKSLRPQPKMEWSEEDEKMLNDIIGTIAYAWGEKSERVSWLRMLRAKLHWKPSEEEMYILNWVANILLNHDSIVEEEAAKKLQSLYNDLKKL